MLTILKEKFRSFDGERSLVIAELAVDVKTELPQANGVEGRMISQGTIAWEISTGDLYGFGGDRKWVNQATGEAYDPTDGE
ncbi:MAG: hypothetical protein K5898_00915 [Ruminococcus sp.]|uniref:hypothetical protein n=1 Tax=Ruminococcus sp. TaxID=41978 RepID=UPI0025F9E643|nr:hypothetical protein [Ruminococcus sp.]MCR4793744.1 hypothetical protein [Ruminococcus sp.]